MGSSLRPDVRGDATGEIRRQTLSAARARRELGWEPAFTLDDRLRRTIEGYRSYLAG
jgi:CDP-glucose 4,6-dehydratase